MLTRNQLKNSAISKLKSVKILINAGDYDTAVYLSGYVVEYALKAVVCKRLCLDSYPDDGNMQSVFRSHDFDRLLTLSGLSKEISVSGDPKLFQNWSDLYTWNPSIRYNPVGTYVKIEAERKIEALEEKPNGLLSYIIRKRKW